MKVEHFTKKKLIGILFGFLGVLITTTSFKEIGQHSSIQFESKYFYAYIIAALGALSYGIFTALLKKIQIVNRKNKKIDVRSKYVGFLIWSSVLHIIYNIFSNQNIIKTFITSFNSEAFIFLLIYAIFNLSVAHFYWVKAADAV